MGACIVFVYGCIHVYIHIHICTRPDDPHLGFRLLFPVLTVKTSARVCMPKPNLNRIWPEGCFCYTLLASGIPKFPAKRRIQDSSHPTIPESSIHVGFA